MVSPQTKKSLAKKAVLLQPLLQVGKQGVSPAFLRELELLMKKKGLVKVRLLRSFADDHDARVVAGSIAGELGLVVISVVGNTAVFYLPRSHEKQ